MKILAVGDSVKLPTGYARVSQKVLGYFVAKGHQVYHVGWGHTEPRENLNIYVDGRHVGAITLLPTVTQGNFYTDSTVYYYNQIHPELLYNSNDFFSSQDLVNRKNDMKSFIVNYGVLDGPEAAKAFKSIIDGIDIPITPSQYGFELLKQVTDRGMYIPHGVDLNMFKPSDVAREELKKKYGLQGKFVFGSVNRNIWRKQFPQMLRALANMKYIHGIKDVAMFIIADAFDQQGCNLVKWAQYLNLSISNQPDQPADVMLNPNYMNILNPLTDELLVESYNSFDVLLSASMSEGFGLPTLEAMACGVPSIMPDNSANTELVKGHGWLYPTVKNIDGSSAFVTPTLFDVTYGYEMPDYAAMEIAMIDAYRKTEMVKNFSRLSLETAKKYDWNRVLPLWDQVLDKVPKKA